MATKKPSIEKLKAKAEGGDVEAQIDLGKKYWDFNNDFEFDPEKAIMWFSKAYEQGSGLAARWIGDTYSCFRIRNYVEDLEAALLWYQRAIDKDCIEDCVEKMIEAQFCLGSFYYYGYNICSPNSRDKTEINYPKAFDWFIQAAANEHVKAHFHIGQMYYFGYGVEQDYESAFQWHLKAAENGDSSAQFVIGIMFSYGQGTKKSSPKAFSWYSKSAHQGNASAQNNLAVMYENGEGTSKNFKEAYKWYKKSAEQDDDMAQMNLARCYELGRGITINKKKAFNLNLKAAMQGNLGGQEALSRYYLDGFGVEPNPLEAYIWAIIYRACDDEIIVGEYFEKIKSSIPHDRVFIERAEDEAEKRLEILRERCLKQEDITIITVSKPKTQPSHPDDHKAALENKLDKIINWRVESPKDLVIRRFLTTKKITFEYNKKRQTFKENEVFNERCLALLKVYYDSRNGGDRLDWDGSNVGLEGGSNRRNHTIVDDFNSCFRKLFGLDSSVKAFRWIGKGRGRTLSTLITIEMM